MVEFAFDIVGGRYDGVQGLSWRADEAHPLPETIFVGLCAVGQDCGMGVCRKSRRHVAFWVPGEELPVGAVTYEKQDEFVVRGPRDDLAGVAVYAVGGLLEPSNFGLHEDVPVPDAVPAWMSEPAVTAEAPDALVAMIKRGRHDRGWPR